jgi:hypothetical protein
MSKRTKSEQDRDDGGDGEDPSEEAHGQWTAGSSQRRRRDLVGVLKKSALHARANVRCSCPGPTAYENVCLLAHLRLADGFGAIAPASFIKIDYRVATINSGPCGRMDQRNLLFFASITDIPAGLYLKLLSMPRNHQNCLVWSAG